MFTRLPQLPFWAGPAAVHYFSSRVFYRLFWRLINSLQRFVIIIILSENSAELGEHELAD